MSFSAISEVLDFEFGKFLQFFKAHICQNLKSRVSETVKLAIFDIQILPKLISRKILKFPVQKEDFFSHLMTVAHAVVSVRP